MRALLGLVVGLALAGCLEPGALPPDAPTPVVVALDDSIPEAAPWGIRILRRCNEWSSTRIDVRDGKVHACGVVFDLASGALVQLEDREGPPPPAAPRGRFSVSMDRGLLVIVGPDGRQTSRSFDEDAELEDVRDAHALVALEHALVLVPLDAPARTPETVLGYRHAGHDARFAGDDILVMTWREELLWLRRGADWNAPPLGLDTPDEIAWVPSSGVLPTGSRVATYSDRSEDEWGAGDWNASLVSLDPAELSSFAGSDVTWAHAIAARYVEPGTDVWLRVHRTADGRRVFRGHSIVSGCAYYHVDVRVRELPDALELTIVSGREPHGDAALGPVPTDALEVAPLVDRHRGDPSIGEQWEPE